MKEEKDPCGHITSCDLVENGSGCEMSVLPISFWCGDLGSELLVGLLPIFGAVFGLGSDQGYFIPD